MWARAARAAAAPALRVVSVGRAAPVCGVRAIAAPAVAPRAPAAALGVSRWSLEGQSACAFSTDADASVSPGSNDLPLPPRILALNTIRDNPGARKAKRRKARGPGSGRGKTAGRGHKGQKSRSGSHVPIGFEGGQTPLQKRVPKRGFRNRFARPMNALNLGRLQSYIDSGRLDATAPITLKELSDCGIVGRFKHGVKLLGTGELKTAITIEVSQASQSAIAAVEAAGGSVVTVYHSPLALRALVKPEKFDLLPRNPRPPPKLMQYYTNDDNRGYLSQRVQLDMARKALSEAEA